MKKIADKIEYFNKSQQEVPYFYKQGMNCFFSFLKLFQKYDIIKSIKDNKKEYFWREVIKKYIQGQGEENENS